MALPFVVVLDLDGCIIGDVSSHLAEWVVTQRTPRSMNRFHNNLQWSLQQGLLRPEFQVFTDAVKAREGIELFVYTASTSDWAKVVIPDIEKVIHFKFNRPLLTREDCLADRVGNTVKCIDHIQPKIFKSLKTKYPALTFAHKLNARVCHIDNSDVLKQRWAWIRTRTYDYVPAHDPIRNIELSVLKSDFPSIYKELVRQDPSFRLRGVVDFDSFMAAYYSKMAHNVATRRLKNHDELKDTFWRACSVTLLPVLSELNRRELLIGERIIRKINDKIASAVSGK